MTIFRPNRVVQPLAGDEADCNGPPAVEFQCLHHLHSGHQLLHGPRQIHFRIADHPLHAGLNDDALGECAHQNGLAERGGKAFGPGTVERGFAANP